MHYVFGLDQDLALLLLFLSVEASIAIAVANADLLATQELTEKQDKMTQEQQNHNKEQLEHMLQIMEAIRSMLNQRVKDYEREKRASKAKTTKP